jgi:dihydroxyacetone kinase
LLLCAHVLLSLLFRLPLHAQGIHNEAGGVQLPLESASCVVRRLVEQLLSRDRERDYFWRWSDQETPREREPGTEVVLLVNNLGAATATELNLFVSEALRLVTERGLIVRRLIAGTLMTALDMRGLSITIMRLDPADAQWQLDALDSETGASGWPRCVVKDPRSPAPIPLPSGPPTEAAGSVAPADASTTTLLATLAATILSHSSRLNTLDARSGDGDCGSTLSAGAKTLQALDPVPDELDALLRLLATSVGESMGGTSGAILQILLTAASVGARRAESGSTSTRLAAALEQGIDAVSMFGGAKVGDRTMLDSLVPAVGAFKASLAQDHGLAQSLSAASQAARLGAHSTRHMSARAGRANYVSGDALAEEDPGAEAVALLWEAAAAWAEKREVTPRSDHLSREMSAAPPRCAENQATLREMGGHLSADQKCTVIIPSDGLPCGALYEAHPEATASSTAGEPYRHSARGATRQTNGQGHTHR